MKKALLIHQANQKLQDRVKQLEKQYSTEQQDHLEQHELATNQIEELRAALTNKSDQCHQFES